MDLVADITDQVTWIDGDLADIQALASGMDQADWVIHAAALIAHGRSMAEQVYEINANVGYQWTKSIGTTIGYRMFDVDYEKGGFLYDVRQQGWQLGLSWAF